MLKPGPAKKVTVYVEIVPTDTVKYELDKETGYLKVDRPQKFSNVVPSLRAASRIACSPLLLPPPITHRVPSGSFVSTM